MAILVIHNSKEDAELINMFLSRVGSSILLRFSSELPSLPFEGSEEPNLLIFQEREGEVSTFSFIDQVRNYYSSLPIIIISQYGGEWYSPSWPKGDFEDYLSKERLWQLPQAVLRQLHFS
ncbi:MAG: hypothetical protein K1X82_13215, partial [Bacteroidia bacterium]|nr:hypothetical protein [Bacteroidia bacterium]